MRSSASRPLSVTAKVGGFVLRALLGALFVLALLGTRAEAEVTGVSAATLPAAVPATGGGAVSVNWTVQRLGPRTGGQPSTVRSAQAEIWAGGNRIAALPGLLQQVSNPPVGTPETLTFSETLMITPAIARQIARASGPALIVREFTDVGTAPGTGVFGSAASGNAALSVSGNAQGALSLRRIELSFEDGSRTGIFNTGAGPRVVAEIAYTSSGILEAEWRAARVEGSGNFERSLGIVRQQLSSAGRGQVRLVSPKLPDEMAGLYEVRLVVRRPVLNFDLPRLRYYISPEEGGRKLDEISLIGPDEGTRVTPATIFAWETAAGAEAYQVEIFSLAPDGASAGTRAPASAELLLGAFDLDTPLVAGKLVPGAASRTKLSDISFARLEPGETYRWRVRAIDGGGRVIARSPLRFFKAP